MSFVEPARVHVGFEHPQREPAVPATHVELVGHRAEQETSDAETPGIGNDVQVVEQIDGRGLVVTDDEGEADRAACVLGQPAELMAIAGGEARVPVLSSLGLRLAVEIGIGEDAAVGAPPTLKMHLRHRENIFGTKRSKRHDRSRGRWPARVVHSFTRAGATLAGVPAGRSLVASRPVPRILAG
ncbi:MAG: hypothetical protein U0Q12_07840 [Vicinamibacterales bacterium]